MIRTPWWTQITRAIKGTKKPYLSAWILSHEEVGTRRIDDAEEWGHHLPLRHGEDLTPSTQTLHIYLWTPSDKEAALYVWSPRCPDVSEASEAWSPWVSESHPRRVQRH